MGWWDWRPCWLKKSRTWMHTSKLFCHVACFAHWNSGIDLKILHRFQRPTLDSEKGHLSSAQERKNYLSPQLKNGLYYNHTLQNLSNERVQNHRTSKFLWSTLDCLLCIFPQDEQFIQNKCSWEIHLFRLVFRASSIATKFIAKTTWLRTKAIP